MNPESIYGILRDITKSFAQSDSTQQLLPEEMDSEATLIGLGLDLVSLPELIDELQSRLGGRDFKIQHIFTPEILNSLTMGQFVQVLVESIHSPKKSPVVVYVDDEEENIFIFQRKFGKKLNLKAFTDPLEGLEFILSNSDVSLVITDEVMPNLTGNELCDAVKKSKPNMKFILITGNPHGDGDLLYKALRQNRFFEFINKPVDFDRNGDEYLAMIQGLLHFSW